MGLETVNTLQGPMILSQNIKVKAILLRYQIDLSLLFYETTSNSVTLSGTLVKPSGHDLPAHEMLNLIQELSTFGEIQSDLNNWHLSNDHIYYLGTMENESLFEMGKSA